MSAEKGTWETRMGGIHAGACAAYSAGCRSVKDIADPEDLAFLAAGGLRPQILFDFAEDFVHGGEPSRADFVKVAHIRRDYFLRVLRGVWAHFEVPEKKLPRRDEEWDGIPWLPRIVRKAQCFLEGTLCPEIMYGCGGDRAFLKRHGLGLDTFLEAVRDSNGSREALVRHVRGG